jgi:hypothetical protein
MFMKQSKLTWFLFAFALMLTIPTTVKTNTKTKLKPTDDLTVYYWFSVPDGYYIGQNRVLDEMDLSGCNQSSLPRCTLSEKGYTVASVGGLNSTPFPLTPYADVLLYWHF